MSGDINVITQSVVSVLVTSVANSFGTERRFQKDLTVAQLKGKLELLTGASSGSMHISVFDKDNHLVCKLDSDSSLLGSYPVDDGMRMHVEDANLTAGEFEDVSKVKKFELSDDDYSKRGDSVRAFKERNKLGRFDPEEQKRREEEAKKKQEEEEKAMSSMKVGDRCEVRMPGQGSRRGAIRFIGSTEFKPGNWVGIQYDEPVGKNDGSVGGKRYFECPAKYGGFVKPVHVVVGDFPEEDLGFEEDEM